MSGIKVLLTLPISTLTSNISFIQLSSLLSGYPASSFIRFQLFFPGSRGGDYAKSEIEGDDEERRMQIAWEEARDGGARSEG